MKRILIITILIIAAFVLGFILRGSPPESSIKTELHEHAAAETEDQIWTCSMHPQIRMPEPGKCPICGMSLIPAKSGDDEEVGERELKLSPVAVKLAEIQTANVERKYVSVEVRMVGKVDYDETRIGYITAWVPGRIDNLYVDYTGITVRKGDHMVYLYSPELLTAQEELLQAIRAMEELKKSGMKIMRETALQTIEAARDKLRLWGLTGKQISKIEKRGKATDHMTIYSPMGGIVIHKNVEEGAYVKTGTRLYTIADLSHLWIKLDAYESDLMWIRYGQEVDIVTEAYAGEIFKGTIAFIDPVLNTKTRTVKVRVNVHNVDGRLKPEMFVHTTIRARVTGAGKVMDAALAGKWICPMHPDIVKESAGSCDICKMPLVRTETLGYASVAGNKEELAPLVIPASAPLITGKRAIVYVSHPEKEGIFEGREITLGPRAGAYYIVKEKLEEGERVVVNGNFKIDSALQILAKPSMMSPEGSVAPGGYAHRGGMAKPDKKAAAGEKHNRGHEAEQTEKTKETKIQIPAAFRAQIDNVLAAYFEIHKALSDDDAKAAQKRSSKLDKAVSSVDRGVLSGNAHMVWMKELNDLRKQAGALKSTSDINKQREAFYLFSEAVTSVVKQLGTSGEKPVLQFHCPMAFGGRGAHWLQNKSNLKNPYFGKMMLKCGELTATLVSPKNESKRQR